MVMVVVVVVVGVVVVGKGSKPLGLFPAAECHHCCSGIPRLSSFSFIDYVAHTQSHPADRDPCKNGGNGGNAGELVGNGRKWPETRRKMGSQGWGRSGQGHKMQGRAGRPKGSTIVNNLHMDCLWFWDYPFEAE